MKDDFWKLDGLGQAELIRTGKASARELLEATIERIERLNPELNAVTALYAEKARRQAGGKSSGRFAGVPTVIKDLMPYPGMINTMGSRLFAQNMVAEATPYSKAIDEAGFVVLGKSATSEFGLLGSTESLLSGRTRNPWNADFSAAGSSGGAAAAVASGMVAIAHASDGGGSIRIPAALNGLFGLKPSGGRTAPSLPQSNRFTRLLSDHCLSKSVRDSAAFLDATERKDAGAPFEPVGFVESPGTEPLRIGFYSRLLIGEEVAGSTRALLEETASLCADLGHSVRETAPPPVDGKAISDAFFIGAGAALDDVARAMAGMIGREPDDTMFEPFTLELIEWYRGLEPGALEKAYANIERSRETMLSFAGEFDVLLTPAIGTPPPRLGFLAPDLGREELIRRTERFAGHTPIHNMAGMCAMSIPLLTDADGLPYGSHFAALPGQEARLLGLAYQLEEAFPWAGRLAAVGDKALGTAAG